MFVVTFYGWQCESIFSRVFDGGPHRVLEELEEDVVQVGRHVHELQRVLTLIVFHAYPTDLVIERIKEKWLKTN
jgi:hypothetical protein